MALITGPELVIFDEPTTALDVTTQVEVLHAFKSARGARAGHDRRLCLARPRRGGADGRPHRRAQRRRDAGAAARPPRCSPPRPTTTRARCSPPPTRRSSRQSPRHDRATPPVLEVRRADRRLRPGRPRRPAARTVLHDVSFTLASARRDAGRDRRIRLGQVDARARDRRPAARARRQRAARRRGAAADLRRPQHATSSAASRSSSRTPTPRSIPRTRSGASSAARSPSTTA